MSKTKELLMQMYDNYESLEGSCNKLEQYYLEHERFAIQPTLKRVKSLKK